MVRQPHRLNEHESDQTPGESEGQRSLVCYSLWGLKEVDLTERLNDNNSNQAKHQETEVTENLH